MSDTPGAGIVAENIVTSYQGDAETRNQEWNIDPGIQSPAGPLGGVSIAHFTVVQKSIHHVLDGKTHTSCLTFHVEGGWNDPPIYTATELLDVVGDSTWAAMALMFASSDPSVATVDAYGVITFGSKVGTAAITITNDLLYGRTQSVLVVVMASDVAPVVFGTDADICAVGVASSAGATGRVADAGHVHEAADHNKPLQFGTDLDIKTVALKNTAGSTGRVADAGHTHEGLPGSDVVLDFGDASDIQAVSNVSSLPGYSKRVADAQHRHMISAALIESIVQDGLNSGRIVPRYVPYNP